MKVRVRRYEGKSESALKGMHLKAILRGQPSEYPDTVNLW